MPRLPFYLNTRSLTSHLFFGPYIFFGIIASFTWLGGILALLGLWVHQGKPRYRSTEAKVVFISDVGAANHVLFECISCVTAGSYILALFAERWLRHVDRLTTGLRRRESVFDWLAIAFGIAGSTGLVLLSVFDAFDYPTIHWSMTVVFVICVAISAIFQTGEVWSLHKDHPDRKWLLRNSIIKLVILLFAITGAIGFGACYGICDGESDARNGHSAKTCGQVTSAAAALEWTVSLILSFYFLTFAADLWPAGKSSPRYMRRLAKWQELHEPGDVKHDFTERGAFQDPARRQDLARQNTAERAAIMKREMWQRNTGVSATRARQESGDISESSETAMVPGQHAPEEYPGGWQNGYAPHTTENQMYGDPTQRSTWSPMTTGQEGTRVNGETYGIPTTGQTLQQSQGYGEASQAPFSGRGTLEEHPGDYQDEAERTKSDAQPPRMGFVTASINSQTVPMSPQASPRAGDGRPMSGLGPIII